MNKNVTLISHLQNAAIAVLTVTVNAISSLKINLRRILTNDLYC